MIFPYFHCPIITWAPVVEQDHGQERFLTDEPNHLFEQGKFAKVNVMAGITENEFVLPAAGK
jgi:acetylcholinesterase